MVYYVIITKCHEKSSMTSDATSLICSEICFFNCFRSFRVSLISRETGHIYAMNIEQTQAPRSRSHKKNKREEGTTLNRCYAIVTLNLNQNIDIISCLIVLCSNLWYIIHMFKAWFALLVHTRVPTDGRYDMYRCVPTHGMMGCTNRLVCTVHIDPLLDRYIISSYHGLN